MNKRVIWMVTPFAVVLLVVLVGFLLPATVTVERSLAMRATPDRIHDHIADLRKFHAWSPWAQRDPNMEVHFEGPRKGKGAVMSWSSETEGEGRLEIIASEPGAFMIYEVDLGMGPPSRGRFEIEPERGRQRVTWSLEAEFGYSLAGRYLGLFIDGMIGPDLLNGLTYLKAEVESLGSPFPDKD